VYDERRDAEGNERAEDEEKAWMVEGTARVSSSLTNRIIGAAIEVQDKLGVGLLESAYEGCLHHELLLRKIPVERQITLPVEYKGIKLDQGYRVDLLVANEVVIEVKAVEELLPRHSMQLITYLRLGGWHVGLLINFHSFPLKQGLRRIVNNYREQ
jgi:GxxExxY protein